MVAMLLGIGVFPVCAQAQKKVVIEDEEPSYQFEKQGRSSDIHLELVFGKITLSRSADQCRIEIHIVNDSIKVILSRSTNVATDTEGEFSERFSFLSYHATKLYVR